MILVSVANSAAVLVFTLASAVAWLPTFAMLLGGLVGGVAGARVGLRIPARATRIATLCISAAITAAFFPRAYAGR